MEMKYLDVVLKCQQLTEVSQLVLSRKAMLVIDHNLLMLKKELDFYNNQRKDIEDRYVKKDDAGFFITSDDNDEYVFDTDSDREAYLSEIQDLNNSLVNIDIMTLSASDEIETYSFDKQYDSLNEHQETMLAWMLTDLN